jgi:thiol-disulfide isomerase/thioredoxin
MKYHKMKNILLASGLILLSIACVRASQTNLDGKGYSIVAQSDLPAQTLVILSKITDTKLEITDSAYVTEKGGFTFEGMASEESNLYYITFGSAQPPGLPIVLENGAKVNMNVTKAANYHMTMTGGKYNGHMLKLYQIYTGYEDKMTEFNAEVARIDPATVTEELRSQTNLRYTSLMQGRATDIQNFITNEPASPATYFAVMYLFNKPEPKLILIGSAVMSKGMSNSAYTANLAKLATEIGPTVEGALAPEINLKTPEGGTLALSSLKGKVVLIDFWASWCGPCRKENPHVKAIYEKYKDKGFEIYGVSLDNSDAQWKAAIAKDGLIWKHVSDHAGWSSSADKLYKVQSIPQTFLLDKDGRIVASGFRSDQLEGLLNQYLK